MKLTTHFSLEEMTRSATAQRLGICNAPNSQQIAALRHLCELLLEPLRLHLNRPVVINSAFCSPRLNRAVGGSPTSQHLFGEAADIRLASREEGLEIVRFIEKNLPYDQMILEHKSRTNGTAEFWLHLSLRVGGTNRRQTLFW